MPVVSSAGSPCRAKTRTRSPPHAAETARPAKRGAKGRIRGNRARDAHVARPFTGPRFLLAYRSKVSATHRSNSSQVHPDSCTSSW